MLFSAAWFLALAAAAAVLGFSGWQIYLVSILVLEGIGTPLALRYVRRELDRRVHASEAALGRE
jgi:hypothetical protein